MKCKICNKHLYEKLDIRTLLNTKKYHIDCSLYLIKKSSTEVIPINNNLIHFEYVFEQRKGLNYNFISMFHYLSMILKYQNIEDWSVIYIYDEEEYIRLDDVSKYLLLNFGQKPIAFISMFSY